MQQLEIEYFFPLTEQIALDLDYEPSRLYAKELNRQRCIEGTVLIGNGGIGYTTVSNIEPNFTIDIDQTPITITSKQKPNIIKRYIYKALGMKWKVK